VRRCGWEQGVARARPSAVRPRVCGPGVQTVSPPSRGTPEMGEGRGEAFDEAGVAFAERVAKQNADGLSALRGEVG